MEFQKGVFQQARLDYLEAEMIRILCNRSLRCDGELREIVKYMDHHYKNDRSALESLKRYFNMGVFTKVTYSDGIIELVDLTREAI